MSKVRVLVGTRKGAFILTSDGKREQWDVSGPHFAGWEMYHLKGSPADPNRLYASQTSGWFGQIIQRSDDGGKTWQQPGTPPDKTTTPEGMPKGESNKFVYDTAAAPLTTHQWYDGTQHPWEFKRVWHIEPSRTDDGGKSWKAINRGLKSPYLPEPAPEVGFCVHRIAMHPAKPGVLFMQLHQGGGAFRSDNAGDTWQEVKGNLPTDFGFPIDIHAHEPNTVYVIPMDPFMRVPPEGKLRVYRSRAGGNEWEPLTKGLPQENCFVNVLRDAMAVDSLDKCGIYFGTTGGQVYVSADGGDTWSTAVRDLPYVLSVEVQTLS